MLTFKICFKKQPRVSQAKLLKQFYFDIYYGLALERKKKKTNTENPFPKKESKVSFLVNLLVPLPPEDPATKLRMQGRFQNREFGCTANRWTGKYIKANLRRETSTSSVSPDDHGRSKVQNN